MVARGGLLRNAAEVATTSVTHGANVVPVPSDGQNDKFHPYRPQILQMINQQNEPKRLCLRRTQTGPW